MSSIISGGGGGSGSTAWGDITGTLSAQTDLQAALDAKISDPGTVTDNAIVRWDGTTGATVQDSSLYVSDLSASVLGLTLPVNSTADANPGNALTITGGQKSAGTGNGGEIQLAGGASSGGQKGAIRFMGNSTGSTRLCVVTQTDNTGFFGYSYPDGAYFRFAFGYFGSGVQVGSATSTEIGVRLARGSTGGFIGFTRSTASTGCTIESEYSKCLTVNEPGGTVYFSFGNIADNTKNGQFWLHKSTEADLRWNTDGGGNIGGSTSTNRPDNVYVKTGIYKSTYRIDPFEYSAGNSGTGITLNWSNGSLQSVTLTGNVTFTLSNPVTGGSYAIRILTGAGGFTATWPAEVKWPGGVAPTITATASRMDLINLLWDGTNYYGSFAQDYTP